MITRLVFALLLACCLSGCRAQHPKPAPQQPFDPLNPVTPEQLETAKERIHLLRADMTDQQVFATLGLSSCYERCFANAGGSSSHAWVSYHLRSPRHALHIVHEIKLTVPRKTTLRSVTLDEVSWRRDEKN